MLELTRKKNESIIIDDNIKVTVLSDAHGQVKLGIEAPDDVEIWREEIYQKMQRDKSDSETSYLIPTIYGFSDGDFEPGEPINAAATKSEK